MYEASSSESWPPEYSFTLQILYFINSKINIFHIVASEIQVLLKQYIIIYFAAFFNDT